MKYTFLVFYLLCMGISQLRAQNNNLNLSKGDTVFWRIIDNRVHVNVYRIQAPLYIVGTVISISKKYGRVEIMPQYYLYACSMSSEEWIKSPRVTVEKKSYYKELEKLEIWDVQQPIHYAEKTALVRPWTDEAQKALTRGVFVSLASCPRIIAINKTKPRTR